MRPLSSRVRAACFLVVLGTVLGSSPADARAYRPAGSVARLIYVFHGVTVSAPHAHVRHGIQGQWLYHSYALDTRRGQQISIRYPDATLLDANARTHLRLSSAGVTMLSEGELEQRVAPGTQHAVFTPAGTVSAIGTDFDVLYRAGIMTVTVIEGAVLVSNGQGDTLVKTGQRTRVKSGVPPSQPFAIDARAAIGWSRSIPLPRNRPGINIALDANGGQVVTVSTQRSAGGAQSGLWDTANIEDGRLGRGWQSGQGATKNQFVILAFAKAAQFTINALALDCAATAGQSTANDLKDFDIRVSGNLKSLASFKTVLSGTCRQTGGLQIFHLRRPVMTTYLMLYCKSNWGGSDGIAVAEMEAISPDGLPTETNSA